MTFKGAIGSLDSQGDLAAKRPSMVGYIYKTAIEGEDGGAMIHVVGKDGSETEITLSAGGEVVKVEGALTTAPDALLNAFVFADDWDVVAPRVKLETARSGNGAM